MIRSLEQETLTAYEIGYSGVIQNRAMVSAAVYWNSTDDAIRFTPVAAYSASNPPPGWPLPPQFVPPGALPSRYTYVNLHHYRQRRLHVRQAVRHQRPAGAAAAQQGGVDGGVVSASQADAAGCGSEHRAAARCGPSCPATARR